MNKNVFITNSNASSIIKSINLKNIDPDFFTDCDFSIEFENMILKWFSDFELKEIAIYKIFYEEPEKIMQIYLKQEKKDFKRYVVTPKQPAYHLDGNCKYLNSNFENYLLPGEIKKFDDNKLKKYRIWFAENKHMLEENKDDLFRSMQFSIFKIREIPSHVVKTNSGKESIDNIELNDFEKKIGHAIENANKYYTSSEKVTEVIKKMAKLSFLGVGPDEISKKIQGLTQDEIKKILYRFHNDYKKPIKKLLKVYYKVKFNRDLSFKAKLLDQLGFKKCRFCYPGDKFSFQEIKVNN